MIIQIKHGNEIKRLDTDTLSEQEIEFYIRYCQRSMQEINNRLLQLKAEQSSTYSEERGALIMKCQESFFIYEKTTKKLMRCLEEMPCSTVGINPKDFMRAARNVLYPEVLNKVITEARAIQERKAVE
ncbi:hypothetical protein DWQ65_03365 [Treponema phagedenis]|uniref:Uncharacterized protein n=1 Tax=Treponema phagedenis TaxID=162 RepID=A0A0B7GSR2_TREPH|nr:hypothetical protein [Treponema phagedenis]EFW38950.1 hypothetical protein HMPREF9554_00525 [Treponema phagedenis F0421]NVP22707.1 hypothetical protein [Treponema phagedenis]NVP23244.1 hypothetical protein [Treponema phagedenis]QEJ95343.1 hypothetical protein FUT79_09085 [Treponema phagedenis]QEK01195.1 hypothetical protein FUT84_08550 [Treponema phagedenis]